MAESPGVRFLLFASIHTLRPSVGTSGERKGEKVRGWFELDERQDLKMTRLLPMACGGMWVARRLCCAFQVSASWGFKAVDRGIWDSLPSDHVVRRLVNQEILIRLTGVRGTNVFELKQHYRMPQICSVVYNPQRMKRNWAIWRDTGAGYISSIPTPL